MMNWEDWEYDIFLHEFDADGMPSEEEDEGEEDFSMDDEGGEEGEETPAEPADEAPADEEDEGEEDFSMDDEGGEETPPESADEPPTEDQDTDQPPEDDDDGEENFEIPDDEGEEGGEPPAEDEGDGEEDFSMDDEGGEGDAPPADDEGGEEGEEAQPTDDNSSEEETNSKLKELESVIFDDLSEDEKKMKITELKALYIQVYKKCGTISEMLAGIRRDEETIQIIEYISNTLIDLKEYVNDYINKVFDSKTYIENLAQLQKYIMIFNAINKVFEQIKEENEE